MMFLLSNWKGILLTLAVSWFLHSIHLMFVRHGYEKELKEQTSFLQDQCQNDKKITQEVSNEYQKSLNSLNSRYKSLRMQYGKCVAISNSNAPTGHNASTSGQLPIPYGIDPQTLLDYARDAEQVRIQLIGAQRFIELIASSRK